MVTRKKTRIRKYKTLKKNKLNKKKTKRKIKKTRIKRKKYNLKGGGVKNIINNLLCDTDVNQINHYYDLGTCKKEGYKTDDVSIGGAGDSTNIIEKFNFDNIIFYSSHNTVVEPVRTKEAPENKIRKRRSSIRSALSEEVDEEFLINFLNCAYKKCSCLEIDISDCEICTKKTSHNSRYNMTDDICQELVEVNNSNQIGSGEKYSCNVRHMFSNKIPLSYIFDQIKYFYKKKILREDQNKKFPPLIIDFDTTRLNLFRFKEDAKKNNYKKLFHTAKNIIGEDIQTVYKGKISLEYLPFPKNIYLRCSRFSKGNGTQFPLLKDENTKSYTYEDFIKKAEKSENELSKLITRAYPDNPLKSLFTGKLTVEKLLKLVENGCNIPAIDFHRKNEVYVVYQALFKGVSFLKVSNKEISENKRIYIEIKDSTIILNSATSTPNRKEGIRGSKIIYKIYNIIDNKIKQSTPPSKIFAMDYPILYIIVNYLNTTYEGALRIDTNPPNYDNTTDTNNERITLYNLKNHEEFIIISISYNAEYRMPNNKNF